MISEAEFSILTQQYPILKTLPAPLRELFQSDARLMAAPTAHVLFDINDSCQAFVMVLSGAIRVIKPAVSGREILLYRVLPGDSCILTVGCLLGHRSYPARGVVEQDVRLIAFSVETFNRLLDQSSTFRQLVFQFFSDRINHLMELVEGVAFLPVEQRLAALLVDHAPQIETTHQHLADELGTVREVVSRHLKDFEGRGLVHLDRGRIQILNPAALAHLADIA